MTWADYLIRHAGDETGREIATKLGVTESNVSRWKKGGQTPDVKYVVLFARVYGRPVLEALVEAEVITPAEAKARPTLAPDFDQLSDDDLLRILRERLQRGGGEHAERGSAAMSEPRRVKQREREYPKMQDKAALDRDDEDD